MSKKVTSRIENERVLVLEREFDAPRDLLFKMYGEAEHLKHFWGPHGWEIPYCKVDFRPGGVWHYCMKCVDKNQGSYFGMEAWGKGIYKEINTPKTLAFTDYFSDKEGGTDPNLPATEVLMEFMDMGEKSKLISRSSYATPEGLQTVMKMGMLEGISQTFERLEQYLVGLQKK